MGGGDDPYVNRWQETKAPWVDWAKGPRVSPTPLPQRGGVLASKRLTWRVLKPPPLNPERITAAPPIGGRAAGGKRAATENAGQQKWANHSVQPPKTADSLKICIPQSKHMNEKTCKREAPFFIYSFSILSSTSKPAMNPQHFWSTLLGNDDRPRGEGFAVAARGPM